MSKPKGPRAKGRAIRTLRSQRGWSRTRLAELSEVSYQHIYNLEEGFKETTGQEVLQRIANALGVDLFYVMHDEADADAADEVQRDQPAA